MEQIVIDYKSTYVTLLDLLCRVLNAGTIRGNERLATARGLVFKFIDHALTLFYLSYGINVQDLPSFKPFRFIDSASMDVLTRATMEAFLVFHYVFFAPTTAEEKDYRYWCYKAAGLVERQNAPTSTEEYRRKQVVEREEFDKLQDNLRSNVIFQSLTDKQKRQILKGRWRLLSWHDIAIDAGLSEMLAQHMYSHLCGYAHSSSLSVVQSVEDHVNKEEEFSASVSMNVVNNITANLIQEFCELFPKAKAILSEDTTGNDTVKACIEIGHHLDDITREYKN